MCSRVSGAITLDTGGLFVPGARRCPGDVKSICFGGALRPPSLRKGGRSG